MQLSHACVNPSSSLSLSKGHMQIDPRALRRTREKPVRIEVSSDID
jgi:hypothetical protein